MEHQRWARNYRSGGARFEPGADRDSVSKTTLREKDMALMTVVGRGRQQPSLAAAAKQLGVATADVDADYGVVPVDPEKGIYAVMVRADRLHPDDSGQPYRGPYANLPIVPLDADDK
jgi:hypothetical protein